MPNYFEFNFAPSGEWQAHAFSGYRAGGPLADESLVPQLEMKRSAGKLELEGLIRLDLILPADARLSIGLSAVVEDAQGGLSYWALRHPAAMPDFHHADGFTLELD